MTIKQAFEVYSVVGRGYNLRDTKGYAWTPEAARAIAQRHLNEEVETSIINLIKIGDNWHRVHVIPIADTAIEGDIEIATNSRIESGDFPDEIIPAMYLEMKGRKRMRLPRKIDKALGYIERLPKTMDCRLYTLRRGAPPGPSFYVWELFEKEEVQRLVWDWLNHEHKVRQK